MNTFYQWKTSLESQYNKTSQDLLIVATLHREQIVISGLYKTYNLPNNHIDIAMYIDKEEETLIDIEVKIREGIRAVQAIIKKKE